jgi:hypothetical protein
MRKGLTGIMASLLVLAIFVTPGHAQSHLLLSEVALSPSDGEFVELYNPTGGTISLGNYYLADNNTYATLPMGTSAPDQGDFIVRFPAGATIAPGQTVVVAMTGAGFFTTYLTAAQFEVVGTSPNVPDMVQVRMPGTPALTNAGEGIVLFYWDGATDLVRDVDMVNAGLPVLANRIAGKTGLLVDGPDADAIASAYLADAVTLPLQPSAPGAGLSTKRVALEAGQETQAGGNGITGHDETSENTLVTWDQAFTAPNPGVVASSASVADPPGAPNARLPIFSPVVGRLRLRLDTDWQARQPSVRIYAVTGEVVYSGAADAHASGTQVLGPGLEPGVYFVTLSDAARSLSRKVVVLGP